MTEAPKEICIDETSEGEHGIFLAARPGAYKNIDVKYIRADLMDWQPIETAPRDEIFLGFWQYVYYGDKSRTCGMSIVEWDELRGFWATYEDDNYRDGQFQEVFSHWMPLPEPPQETNT